MGERKRILKVNLREFGGDLFTPVGIYLGNASTSKYGFLLESAVAGETVGRYSFIGMEPFAVIKAYLNHVEIEELGKKPKIIKDNPFGYVSNYINSYHIDSSNRGLPPFVGGAIGYFGFDCIRYIEKIPSKHKRNLPLAHLALYDRVIVFDHLESKIIAIALDGDIPGRNRNSAKRFLDSLSFNCKNMGFLAFKTTSQLDSRMKIKYHLTKNEFIKKVKKVQEYIKDGDAYQVVLSVPMSMQRKIEPFDVYRTLRRLNPSPYMYFLKMDSEFVAGTSPEMLVRIRGGVIESVPIAGTRPRGNDEREDMIFSETLLTDEKELAEHRMLVDLSRNDLGRVCEAGSIEVKEWMKIIRYSHVMHIVSKVEGNLKEGIEPLSAFMNCFPAGTVSGAPKIRAVEIIEELEKEPRGLYAGAITYIDFRGNLDSCIAIRTIHFEDGKINFQAGAGIVFDSIPKKEWQEISGKARVLIDACSYDYKKDPIS